jgi:hypothetical protein
MLYAKFIEIKTSVKESENKYKFSDAEIDRMKKIYAKFDFVEFKDSEDFSCMFCAIHNNYIPELFQLFIDLSIGFTYKDLTKDVLYGNISTEDVYFNSDIDEADFNSMLDMFINDHLDVDVVLDKVLELGKESLTERDIMMLERA